MGAQCHMGPIIPAALVTSQLDSDLFITYITTALWCICSFALHVVTGKQRITTSTNNNRSQDAARCLIGIENFVQKAMKERKSLTEHAQSHSAKHTGGTVTASNHLQTCLGVHAFPGSWRLMGADQSCGLPCSEQEPYPTWWCDNSKFTLNALLKVFFSEISENRLNMFLFLIKNNSLSSDCGAWSAFKRDLLAVFNTA